MPTASSGSPPLRHASTIYSYYNSSKPSVNNNCSLRIFFIGRPRLSRAVLPLLQTRLFSLTVRLSAASPHKLQNRPDQQAAEKNASPNRPPPGSVPTPPNAIPQKNPAMYPTAAAADKISA